MGSSIANDYYCLGDVVDGRTVLLKNFVTKNVVRFVLTSYFVKNETLCVAKLSQLLSNRWIVVPNIEQKTFRFGEKILTCYTRTIFVEDEYGRHHDVVRMLQKHGVAR